MDLFAAFPKLISLCSDGTHYEGILNAGKQDFFVQLQLQKSSSGDTVCCCLNGEWKLWELLQPHKELIAQRLKNSSSPTAFLVELKHVLENELNNRQHRSNVVPLPKFYAHLVNDIDRLGWHRLSFIDSKFQILHMTSIDGKQRQHTLKLHLHQQHPDQAPLFDGDIPLPFQFAWTSESKLSDVFQQFESRIQQFQLFWDVMDEVDSKSCVLEPEKPSRSSVHRRIALGKNVSLQIEVDPRFPLMIPSCRFLGADHVCGPLKEKLNKNLMNWDREEASLLKNLQSILEMQFPSKDTTKREDFSSDCGICYSYRLGDEIPDQSCDDERCAQTFHISCLCEWLRSIASTRQSFNVLFGECPYCSKSISVKMNQR